jgi:hypothetical protein
VHLPLLPLTTIRVSQGYNQKLWIEKRKEHILR